MIYGVLFFLFGSLLLAPAGLVIPSFGYSLMFQKFFYISCATLHEFLALNLHWCFLGSRAEFRKNSGFWMSPPCWKCGFSRADPALGLHHFLIPVCSHGVGEEQTQNHRLRKAGNALQCPSPSPSKPSISAARFSTDHAQLLAGLAPGAPPAAPWAQASV